MAREKLRCRSPAWGIEDQWNFFDSVAFLLHSLGANRRLPDGDIDSSVLRTDSPRRYLIGQVLFFVAVINLKASVQLFFFF